MEGCVFIKTLYQVFLTGIIVLTLLVGLKPADYTPAAKSMLTASQNENVSEAALLLELPADQKPEQITPEPKSEPESKPASEPIPEPAPPQAVTETIAQTTPARAAQSPAVSRGQQTRPAAPTTPKSSAPVQAKVTSPAAAAPATPPAAPATKSAAVISTAKKYIGVKYQWGGTTTSGFDCSGYTQFVFAQHDIVLPRVSRDQYTTGKVIALNSLQQGDLLFFSLDGDKIVDHVGIYIGNNQFIHASSSKGVTIANYSSYWTTRTIGAKRVL